MKPGIHISKVWFDDDFIELQVRVSNGVSTFSNNVYVGHGALEDAVTALQVFKDDVHGGIFDLRFGAFGSEFANGAFCARFQFASPGRLYVSCEQESEYEEFAKKVVASKCTLYVKSEPVLLDRFIAELRAMGSGAREEAFLEVI